MSGNLLEVSTSGGRRYSVEIAHGLLGQLDEALERHGIVGRCVLVSSPLIWRLVVDRLPGALMAAEPVLIADGERQKMLSTVSKAYDAFARLGVDRGTTIVAIGGGVLGDTAGFAAATFLRGLDVVHVPTTLLAQVDSAIGGKVGVNHAAGKNLIGAFHPPRAVLVDPDVLATLPRREFRAGLYEVVKYGAIADAALFDTLETQLSSIFARDAVRLVDVISACCAIKARVVSNDEHERGERRILNFGHTAGHALEAITRYRRFRHGEAVAYGMRVAARIAARRGELPASVEDRLNALLRQMGPLPPVADLSASEALEAIRHDKKVIDGRLHFVLPTQIGSVRVVTDVNETELHGALRECGLKV